MVLVLVLVLLWAAGRDLPGALVNALEPELACVRETIHDRAHEKRERVVEGHHSTGFATRARPRSVSERGCQRLSSLPHLGDGLVFQICREVQREHWNPPVGIEVVGPLPRKYGTL
jgi:hypothetical protein